MLNLRYTLLVAYVRGIRDQVCIRRCADRYSPDEVGETAVATQEHASGAKG